MVLQPIKQAVRAYLCRQVADVCLQRRRKPRPTVMRRVFSRVSGCELPTGELVMAFFLGARLISAAVPLFFFR